MGRVRPSRAGIVAFALVAAACTPAPIQLPEDVQVACSPNGLVRFPAAFLRGPDFTPLEFEVTTEPGRALRPVFRDDPDDLYTAADGFSVVSDTLVLAYRDRAPSAFFLLEGERLLDWGPCRPRFVDGASFTVPWQLGGPPDGTRLRLRVEAPTCLTVSGRRAVARLSSIDVTEASRRVEIAVWVSEPDRATCRGTSEFVETEVELAAPLGNRTLRDSGTAPPTPVVLP